MKTPAIAVLGIQGGIEEHLAMLKTVPGIEAFATIKAYELEAADGIILPGGESTAIGKLIEDFGLAHSITQKAHAGAPIWGTCAGAILLAKTIENDFRCHLALMDITIKRNAYGTQMNSFIDYQVLPFLGSEVFPLVFIRAPIITRVYGNAIILGKHGNDIIAVQQENLIATTFHPELAENNRFHAWFANKVLEHSRQAS